MSDLALSPYAFACTAAALGTAAVRPAVLRRAEAPGARLFALILAAGTFWSLTEAAILSTWNVEAKRILAAAQYVAIVSVGPLWLLFTSRYTGLVPALWRAPVRAALFIVPLGVVAAAWTNDAHRLFWRRLDIARGGPFPLSDVEYGPIFRIHQAYSYACFAVGAVILWTAFVRAPEERRPQIGAAFMFPALPLLVNAAYVFAIAGPRVDITPIGFALACVLVGRALFRHRLFDLVPLARDTIVDALPDPVFVVDARGEPLDANRAAKALLAAHPGALRRVLDAPESEVETPVGDRFFERSRSPVGDASGAVAMRLHDVTERRRVARELAEAQMRLRDSHAELERIATTDALTGLPNRRAFFDRLREEIRRCARSGRPLSIAIGDLDGFKLINDRFGHPAGDSALEFVAAGLRRVKREQDVAARVGGEEFGLILPDTDLAGGCVMAERARAAVGPGGVQGLAAGLETTMSLGVAQFREGQTDADLYAVADAALYDAKRAGRNRVIAAPPAADLPDLPEDRGR